MEPIARLGGVTLDCSDPVSLADFYRSLLGLETMLEMDGLVALKGAAILLTTYQVDDYQAPQWPDGPIPKQLHLELAVTDLDGAAPTAVALGATKASIQPNPEAWRILIDPAGHPFCLTTLIPDF
jgi:glyoxalase superfamily protein